MSSSGAVRSYDENRTRAFLWVLAALLIGYAVQFRFGTFDSAAMPWLTGGLILCTAALTLTGVGLTPPRAQQLLTAVLLVGLVWELSLLHTSTPGILDREPSSNLRILYWIGVYGATVSGAFALAGLTWRLWLPLATSAFLVIATFMVQVPVVGNDVTLFHQDSLKALLQGVNPYAITFPDIYGANSRFYPPGLVADGRVNTGFGYPPLSLLFALPGHLLGEFRYSCMAASVAAAWLVALTRPGRLAALAAALYLFMPRSFFVIQMGWTEPFVVLLVALTAFLHFRVPRLVPYSLGLLISIKQHMFLAFPLALLLLPRISLRGFWGWTWRAAAVALLINLPFLSWNPSAYLHSLTIVPLSHQYRPDSLSYAVWLTTETGLQMPAAVSLAAAAAAIALSLWKAPRSAAGFCASIALVFLCLFAFRAYAFCNYYYFVGGSLLIAVGSTELGESVPTDTDAPPPYKPALGLAGNESQS